MITSDNTAVPPVVSEPPLSLLMFVFVDSAVS